MISEKPLQPNDYPCFVSLKTFWGIYSKRFGAYLIASAPYILPRKTNSNRNHYGIAKLKGKSKGSELYSTPLILRDYSRNHARSHSSRLHNLYQRAKAVEPYQELVLDLEVSKHISQTNLCASVVYGRLPKSVVFRKEF